MIDPANLTLPENPTDGERDAFVMLLAESVKELAATMAAYAEELKTLADSKVPEVNETERVSDRVYAAPKVEIPEGERWIKISDKIYHYIADNGSRIVKNLSEYEEAHRPFHETSPIETKDSPQAYEQTSSEETAKANILKSEQDEDEDDED